MSVLPLRFTRGSDTLRITAPGRFEVSALDNASSAEVAGRVQLAVPAGGSSATMPSLSPRYGSQTAVQPPALTARYRPPFMNCAVTLRPAELVNGPGVVWLDWNGAAQAASR